MLVYGASVSPTTRTSAVSNQSLPQLGAEVAVPKYDRSGLRPSIVHIGVGGFHRAHLATYVNELCAAGRSEWAIVGSGVRADDSAMAEALLGQDCLYSLISRDSDTTTVEIIGSIIDYIHAVPDAARLVEQIAAPATEIVSLTITEGGYPVDDVTGEYLPASKNAGPGSTFAIIAEALELRRTTNAKPITVMSCDNIMGNGAVTKSATLGEAACISAELVEWISASVSFPNSMVDRITPATSPADQEWLIATHGIDDAWPVVAEPFRQWVIEDDFAGERLPLDELDVIVTHDVEPYEFMKLRLLNAGHSCLAYLAALDGIELVDEAMADPNIRRYVDALLHHEAKPVLPAVAGIDVDVYIGSLIERFSNPAVGDQIARLCLDGTAKFPKFLLPTVRAQLDAGGSVRLSALALAGWCEYLTQARDTLAADPLLDQAIDHANQSQQDPAAFLGFTDVFGADLRGADRFTDAFVRALGHLRSQGVASAINATLQEVGRPHDGSIG